MREDESVNMDDVDLRTCGWVGETQKEVREKHHRLWDVRSVPGDLMGRQKMLDLKTQKTQMGGLLSESQQRIKELEWELHQLYVTRWIITTYLIHPVKSFVPFFFHSSS